MSIYLKTLGHKVYQAITKESYPNDGKHKKANALALKVLRASIDKDLLYVFAHYDSTFAVWSILTSPELPKIIDKMRSLGETSPTSVASWSKGMTPLRYNQNLN